jgi:phosphohistidine phosphatase
MKTLLLLRHAKSSWNEAGLDDHDRPLNERGKRDAPRMGGLLREQNLVPDAILTSTAKRAFKTARKVAQKSGFAGQLQDRAELYLASPAVYLDLLSRLPEHVQRPLVVGHNPALEELVESLTGRQEELPTAALVQIEMPIERWSELVNDNTNKTQGELVRIWRPSEPE